MPLRSRHCDYDCPFTGQRLSNGMPQTVSRAGN